MIELSCLAAGGFFGAMARYGVQSFFSARWPTFFPFGTLVVNLLGSFLLGWIVGNDIHGSLGLFLGTGFMGAFTTFSTLNLESANLFQNGKRKIGILYLVLTYVLGIVMAGLGVYIAV